MEWRVKLHRKFLNWERYDDLPTKVLFIHLLLKVNHKDNKWRWYDIKRWQTLTSLSTLELETWLSVKQIRRALLNLEKTNEVANKSSSKNRLITIIKYDEYQNKDKQEGKQKTNEGQAKGKAGAINKNDKEWKEIYIKWLNLTNIEYKKLVDKFWKENTNNTIDSLNNSKTKTRYFSHYRTLINRCKKNWWSKQLPKTKPMSVKEIKKQIVNNPEYLKICKYWKEKTWMCLLKMIELWTITVDDIPSYYKILKEKASEYWITNQNWISRNTMYSIIEKRYYRCKENNKNWFSTLLNFLSNNKD